MASVVQICNMALSHIGADARVSSVSPPDGSVEAGHCATFYDPARTELIEPGNWAFTLARASLAPVTAPTGTNWTYAYAKPSDCLRPLRVLQISSAVTVFTQDTVALVAHDGSSADFEVEGDLVLTHQPEAVLIYARDVTDTTKFTPSFTAALGYLLASYIAGPVVKGTEGLRLGDAMRQRALAIADVSAAASANASSAQVVLESSIQAARR